MEWNYFVDYNAQRSLNLVQVCFWTKLCKQPRWLHLQASFMQNDWQPNLGKHGFHSSKNYEYNSNPARPDSLNPYLAFRSYRLPQPKIPRANKSLEHHHSWLYKQALLLLAVSIWPKHHNVRRCLAPFNQLCSQQHTKRSHHILQLYYSYNELLAGWRHIDCWFALPCLCWVGN